MSSSSRPGAARTASTVPSWRRPVTLRCSRVDFELSANAREKLVRRVRHLSGAASLVPKLDETSHPVELTANEKGFLVVAITAWMESAGRSRVPGELLRLHTTLLGDLYYPVEETEIRPGEADAPLDAPVEPQTPEADAEATARLISVRATLEQELQVLEQLDDGSLGRARAALRTAIAELGSALE
jgi:hypothetical protein